MFQESYKSLCISVLDHLHVHDNENKLKRRLVQFIQSLYQHHSNSVIKKAQQIIGGKKAKVWFWEAVFGI